MEVIVIQPYEEQPTEAEFTYPELIDKDTGESIWIGSHIGLNGVELLNLWITTRAQNDYLEEPVKVMEPRSSDKMDTLEDDKKILQKMIDKHGGVYCVPSRVGTRVIVEYIRGEFRYFGHNMTKLTRIFFTRWGADIEEEIKTFMMLLPQGYGLDGIVVNCNRKFIFDIEYIKYNEVLLCYLIRDIIPPIGDETTAIKRWSIMNQAYEVYMESYGEPYSFKLTPRILINDIKTYCDVLQDCRTRYKFFILYPPESIYEHGSTRKVAKLRNRYYPESESDKKDKGSRMVTVVCGNSPFFFHQQITLDEAIR